MAGPDVGALFRAVQRYTGASQSRIAAATGLLQGRVSEILKGRRTVTAFDVFERIADGIGMSDEARIVLGLAPRHPTGIAHLGPAGCAEVAAVYTSQHDVVSDIRTAVKAASEVDILAVRGLGIIGLNDSLLRPAITGSGPPIEAELKARVRDPDHVRAVLARWATEDDAVCSDTYFDSRDGSLTGQDRELRVREVREGDGVTGILTYKGAAVDAASGSKPESETQVSDAAAARDILLGLGYVVEIAFEKQCSNYRFEHAGRPMLATVVRVPELDGTFIEVETLVGEEEVTAALDNVRSVLTELGIASEDETTDTYTGAVRAARG